MSPEPLSLDTHVERLIAFCERACAPLPAWQGCRVLDTSDPRVRVAPGAPHRLRLPANALHPLAEVRARFDGLLRSGYSWINLSAYGVFRGDLIVAVELPREPVGAPPGQTAVNYSGPPRGPNGAPIWELELVLTS